MICLIDKTLNWIHNLGFFRTINIWTFFKEIFWLVDGKFSRILKQEPINFDVLSDTNIYNCISFTSSDRPLVTVHWLSEISYCHGKFHTFQMMRNAKSKRRKYSNSSKWIADRFANTLCTEYYLNLMGAYFVVWTSRCGLRIGVLIKTIGKLRNLE